MFQHLEKDWKFIISFERKNEGLFYRLGETLEGIREFREFLFLLRFLHEPMRGDCEDEYSEKMEGKRCKL